MPIDHKRKSKRRKQKFPHRDNHHVYPTSRKKKGDLGKFKPILRSLRLRKKLKPHNAWHRIFINLFAEEVLLLVKRAFQEGKKSQEEIILFVRRACCGKYADNIEVTKDDPPAWREIFNSYWSWRKIKKVIKKEWMYPGIKSIISKGKVIGVMVFLKNVPKKAKILNNMSRCKDIQITFLKNGELLKIT